MRRVDAGNRAVQGREGSQADPHGFQADTYFDSPLFTWAPRQQQRSLYNASKENVYLPVCVSAFMTQL